MRGIHMMLHNALDRAVKEKLILSNPTENCIIPKIEKQEMKILHPDHISAYLNAAERRNALPMFYLELVSGLRKGELVALQWSDLDEANCTISVSKQASWDTEGNLILSQPKTGNSIREVSIPQDAVELLKQEHAKHPDTNAARNPIIITGTDNPDSAGENPPFIKSRRASPKIGIITIRNENRATCSFLFPSMSPVAIVVPERESPGKTATACERPMMNASR